MNSQTTEDFDLCFQRLPARVQRIARRNYELWTDNPSHPSLQYKPVGHHGAVYSVRVGIGWRALGLKVQDTMVWFWIGSHAEYDKIVRSL